jgi:hypothetical protein
MLVPALQQHGGLQGSFYDVGRHPAKEFFPAPAMWFSLVISARRLFGYGLFAASLALWPQARAAADPADCPSFTAPQVKLTTVESDADRNLGRSLDDLRQMARQKGGTVVHRNTYFLGLATAEVTSEMTFSLRLRQRPDGSYCSLPEQVNLRFGYRQPRIYVARELTRDDCVQTEVLNHELKHVEVDRRLLAEYAPRIAATVTEAVGRLTPVRTRTRDSAILRFKAELTPVIDGEVRAFLAERERRQAEVDTPAEYERVAKSCGGRVGRLITESRRTAPAPAAPKP